MKETKQIELIPVIHSATRKLPGARRLLQLAAVGALVLGSNESKAGVLLEIYTKAMATDATVKSADYLTKSAEQNMVTEKRRYLPRLTALDRELWIYQDVIESGNPAFQNGTANYGSNHFEVQLDQPIYDPTIQPLVQASMDRKKQAQARGKEAANLRTRQIVEGFLQVVRFHDLIQSSDRAIARLEKEQAAVSKSYEAKVAPIADVQSISLSLAAMKRERNQFTQQVYLGLARMGASSDIMKSSWVHLAPKANPSSRLVASARNGSQQAELEILQAEASELDHQASAAKRRSWPVLSLFGRYNLDKDGGSVFGGPLDIRTYGVGVAVKWDIFDRGMNLSEAKELNYRKQAKEAELKGILDEQARADAYGRELLNQMNRSTNELVDMVQRHKALMEISARAYAEGKESYLNSISAYLAYEATVREWTNAQNDLLKSQVAFYAESAGWNVELIKTLDAMFVATKN